MKKTVVAAYETSKQADQISKTLVEHGFPGRYISVSGEGEGADGNNPIDTAQELKSDGNTLGGQTGYLASAGLAMIPNHGATSYSSPVPGLADNSAAAGISANFVDLGIPRSDLRWCRSQLSKARYLVFVRHLEDQVPAAKAIMEPDAADLLVYQE